MKTVRIEFSKQGRAKYISHLDLTRMMTRAVRRAALPVWYTEGFNRHPYLTFAAPLSLGYEGLRETMDLRLVEEMEYSVLVERLNAAMPEGFEILSAYEAVAKPRDLVRATYRLTTNCPSDLVRELLASHQILVEKRTKKKEIKTVDIAPYFKDAVVSDGTKIDVTLPCGGAETINPSLFFDALDSHTGDKWDRAVVRIALLQKDGALFR